MIHWLLCLVVGALWAVDTSPASAAQVGTALVNGRIVILTDDNTWRFADAPDARAAATCDRLTGVELCIKDLGWTQVPKIGAFSAIYLNAGRYYFGVIQEPYGASAGVSLEALQTFLVKNTAQIANVKPEQVPIISATASVPRVSGARDRIFGPYVRRAVRVLQRLQSA